MEYGKRDASGRFAKKAIRENDATAVTTEAKEDQEQDNVTAPYCNSFKGVGALVDEALASVGIVLTW